VRADGIFYYPIDIRSVVRKVLKAVDPSAYVIIETELWPNMLEEASAMGIPVILANGRISDRSFAGYKKLGFITRKMLSCFSTLCVQTPRDAGKLRELGCGTHKIRVTGNIKFDGAISSVKDPEVEKTERFFASGKKVIVAGSTHFPEESGIIDEFVRFSGASRGMKLIIAPRHVERKEAIKVYVESSGLKCCFFSELSGEKCHEMSSADVMIVDTIGHLKDLYSLADVVFIGGSMVKKGGQNPIEAARWGKAIVFGSDMSNFSEVARDFVGGGAALVANDFKRLGGIIEDLMANDAKRLKMGKASGEVIEKNSGAVDRTVEAILEKVKYR
nr:glycosyltransferase N-terminal domain-containing protein [Candidatus Omnitrophota bacterium]